MILLVNLEKTSVTFQLEEGDTELEMSRLAVALREHKTIRVRLNGFTIEEN